MRVITEREMDQVSKVTLLKECDEEYEVERAAYKIATDEIVELIASNRSNQQYNKGLIGVQVITAFFFATYTVPLNAYVGMGIVILYALMAIKTLGYLTGAEARILELQELLLAFRNNHRAKCKHMAEVRETIIKVCNGED